MNREIKFRAWDEERNEMIYQDKHTSFQIADWFIGIDCDDTKNYEYREWSWNGWLNCILMQYTWLKDKNGNDIYEGDIIKYWESNPEYFIIYFENGWFIGKKHNTLSVKHPVKDLLLDRMEQYWNIYQNPELSPN